jgi:uncharacterized lipoprotein NlpE involved in copper resistance
MRGMYSYLADVPVFTECVSGGNLPVALEGDNKALKPACRCDMSRVKRCS